MKIAFLSFYSGQIDRGVEVATTELANRMGISHTVTVYQAGERLFSGVAAMRISLAVDWKVKDASGLWTRRLYLDYWSRKIAAFTIKCIPLLWKEKYDVIIPTNGGWQVVLCRIVSWIRGAKMLVQGNAGVGADDIFQMLCYPDYYVAISPQGFHWAKHYAPWVKKTYIPYGVDLELFKNSKAANVDLHKPVILCVAAFSPYKRIDLLIKAMTQVKSGSLLVIGQGELENKLRDLGMRLLGKRFQLLTGITHDQLARYYKAADVFSLPSESSEAFGIVYIEALASGLPIVAPDDYNRRAILEEAGIYVNPEDTNQYATAIRLALDGDTGNKSILLAKKFSWEKITKQYEDLLNSL